MAHPEAGRLSREVINIRYFASEFESPREPLARVKFGTSGHRGRLGGGFSRRHAEAPAISSTSQMQALRNRTTARLPSLLMSRAFFVSIAF